jgi:hypothetical protein
MSAINQKTFLSGLLGLILIVLGIKTMPTFLQAVGQQSQLSDGPAVIFFNVDDPCECMFELTQQADLQLANWTRENHSGISLIRIAMDQRRDLEAKYKVFRAPCLVLVDAQDRIVWRQDYPLITGGPFRLDELEVAIESLELRQ